MTNNDGNYFFIVNKGILGSIDITKEKILKDWDCFSKLALIEYKKRTDEIKCLDNSELYVMDF